ncbi:MAG TPA: MFS transporter [Tepidisphaeraceae bacterium]|jgi:MFS family permease|nr:MFS transporter [Tepidisphaeraceae bacterium]
MIRRPMEAAPPFSGSDDERPSRAALIFRALAHRNYRLFFAGQLVSLVGTFLTQVATVWLVYYLTGSPLLLGVAGFAGQIPMFLLAPFAGVWVDRWNRKRLLVVTQTLAMLQSFALAALAMRADPHHPQVVVGGIIALAVVQGLINAFDLPGRQAFLVELVERRDDLANAIALNSTMVHGARLVGPAIAGFVIHALGESARSAGWCFFIDGVTYIAVIAALLRIRVAPRPPRTDGRSVLHELAEGLRYIFGSAPIRAMLLLMAIISLTGMPAFSVLMPVFAQHFGGKTHSAQTLGLLMGASGLGALIGAIYLASRRSVVGLGRVIAVASCLFGAALIAFSFSRAYWLSLAIVPVGGLGMIICFASANTILQTLTDDHMRGRVMSFFTMAFVGMTPWGNLLAGWAASKLATPGTEVVGASRTVMIAGAVVIIASVSFALKLPALRKIVRPLFIQKGILPTELAAGMQSATDVVSTSEA